jgi:pyroglutamyl-peptidase
MCILLTAFEPFGCRTVNTSAQVLENIALLTPPDLQTRLLPVDTVTAPGLLLKHLDELCPDAVICLGEASTIQQAHIERLAVNLLDFRIPDNAGIQVFDQPIIPDAFAAYFSTLPVRAIFDAIHSAGIDVQLSLSAGSYLCNQVFYTLLHHLSQRSAPIPAGFIHLPALDPADEGYTDALEALVQVVRIALQVTAESCEITENNK